MKLKNLCQTLSVLTLLVILNSCAEIKIKNTEACSVAGRLQDGMICAETLTAKTRRLNFDEMVTFLEADIENQKGGAICQSLSDWNHLKTLLEQACSLLQKRCSYEMKEAIKNLKNIPPQQD